MTVPLTTMVDDPVTSGVDEAGTYAFIDVIPGTYTVTLMARDQESKQTVRVKGDPALRLSDGDYRATEDYLLRVRALGERVQRAASAASGDDAAALQTLLREVGGLGRGLGDSGRFNDGNFGPPTAADQRRLTEMEVEVARITGIAAEDP